MSSSRDRGQNSSENSGEGPLVPVPCCGEVSHMSGDVAET